MAHPKRRQSTSRRNKRRTHYTASTPQIATDTTTGEPHIFHHAHWSGDKLYYKGKVVIDRTEA